MIKIMHGNRNGKAPSKGSLNNINSKFDKSRVSLSNIRKQTHTSRAWSIWEVPESTNPHSKEGLLEEVAIAYMKFELFKGR